MTTPLQVVKADPTTLPVGKQSQQICPRLGEGQSVIVYNNDLTNIAYAGYRTSGLAISNTVPIQPLASVTLDASRVMYAFCPTATVSLTVAPLGTNIQPSPAQIAQQINALGLATLSAQNTQIGQLSSAPTATISQDIATNGAPLLHGANAVMTNQTFTPIPAGGSTLTSIMQVHKPGYFIALNASPTAPGSTIPFIVVQLYWYADAAGSETVALEQWTIPTGTVLVGYAVMGRGLTKGGYLKLQFFNLDPAITATLVVQTITETTQHIARDDWRVQAAQAVTTFVTPPNSQVLSNLLSAGTINPGGSYLLPLYSGEADLCVNTMIAGQTMTITSPNLGGYLPAGLSFYQATGVAGNVNQQRIILPRFPTVISLSGAAGAVGFSITALEYAS